MSYSRIKPRRGTLYEWSTVNPVLDEGELGVIYPDTGVGTGLCKFKIGDGVHKFTEIPYAFDGASAASINGGTVENFHIIQIRSGSEEEWLLVNPILAENELGFDTTNKCFKVGNGTDTWEDLEYTQSGDVIGGVSDYGDEDAVDVIAAMAAPASVEIPDDSADGVSTLADMVSEPIAEDETKEESTEEVQSDEETEESIEDDSEDPMQEKEDIATE